MTYRGPWFYRPEAVAQFDRPHDEGHPLHLSPRWVGWSYWVLAVVASATLVFTALADLGEYARGPGVIRIAGRAPVAAVGHGVVASLEVQPGQRVEQGDVLVRFHDAAELAEMQRLDQQLDAELTEYVRDPTNARGKEQLAALHAQRDLARARLAQRMVRAQAEGVVSDMRIRPGQSIAPGQVMLTLSADEADGAVIAMLPGHFRPLLEPGMELQLELTGFAHHHQRVRIESIGDEIIGPDEVKRFLGAERADALALTGPLVLVRARLPERTFEVDRQHYNYFDGMQGKAEVRVRAQSVLTTLIPGLDKLGSGA